MPHGPSETSRKALKVRAEKILAKLAHPGAYLKAIPSPTKGATGDAAARPKPCFGLFVTDKNCQTPDAHAADCHAADCHAADNTTPVTRFGTGILKYLLAQDWVRKTGKTFTITSAGHAALKRRSANRDKYRSQHQSRATQTREIEADVRRPVTVNETESPLGWLRKRRDRHGAPLINDAQFQAGERLRADFWRAQMTPRVTMSWSASASSKRVRRSTPGNAVELSDAVIAAKARIAKALDAVGPELSGVLIDVCCHMTGLEHLEQEAGWPQRSGKLALKFALNALARHYGLIATPRAQWADGKIRHWGAADYRPTLDSWNSASNKD